MAMRGFTSHFERGVLVWQVAVWDWRDDGTLTSRQNTGVPNARVSQAACNGTAPTSRRTRDSLELPRVRRPPGAYQRYATDIWYWRPAIGRPMNTPPVAAPGTRTLPSVKPRVSVTLLPLAVTSQWSPTCRLAPMSTMS